MAREVSTWHGKRKRWECERCGITYELESVADKCCAGKDRAVETAILDEWRQFTEGVVAPAPTIPDHADAAATVLERAARDIRAGRSVEDVANDLLHAVRIMARRT